MSLPSILVTRRIPESALAILRAAGTVDLPQEPPAADALRAAVRGRDAIVTMLTDRVDDALLDAAGPSLKIVANVAVGYDNVDVAAARGRKVIVTNTPDVLTGAVAEFTWGLILGITRRIAEGDRLIRRDGWHGWSFTFMTGMELTGKQLGIIGPGRIGRAVADRASAFGMHVVFGARQSGGVIDDHPVVGIDEAVATSDVVSLHVPLRPETRHLIDAAAIARMKKTAYLINTARGPIVDEAALAAALRDGVIAGAALDVFEREPVVHPDLLPLENVLLVPHLGSATTETRTAMAELAARNVANVLAGRAPITAV
jgi:glyoxylate reductase